MKIVYLFVFLFCMLVINEKDVIEFLVYFDRI